MVVTMILFQCLRVFDEKNQRGSYSKKEVELLAELNRTVKDENKYAEIG